MPKTKKVKPVTFKTWMIEVEPGEWHADSGKAPHSFSSRAWAQRASVDDKKWGFLPRTAAVRRVTVSISVEA